MCSYRISQGVLYVDGSELTQQQLQQIAAVLKELKIEKLKIKLNYPLKEPTYD